MSQYLLLYSITSFPLSFLDFISG
uniref:Uncharacterized protein n=1 Tax=Anguilla anguilla TaxID=7936 RepID=A0A0E9QDR9_ANGAN